MLDAELNWNVSLMQLSPKALLSDFGTSEEMLRGRRERTGHTGTMEYMVNMAERGAR